MLTVLHKIKIKVFKICSNQYSDVKLVRESLRKLFDLIILNFILFAAKYMIFHYLNNTSEGHMLETSMFCSNKKV